MNDRASRPDAIPDSAPSCPKRTDSTAGGSDSIVITTSAPRAASAGDDATRAPAEASGAARSDVRFHTVTSRPAATNRCAIGAPM